ncbi:MAG: histidinol-phosphate transaminase, partial [Verrucomicrobia bacterium]|nr:histidinol-phosphate transaminase [Verrucomicrobiota bacterium]
QTPDAKGCGLFMLANPNAPTGLSFNVGKIRSFCVDFDGVVVIDEAYAEFAREDCMALTREFSNVLVVRTLSKSYSLAGARLGYAIGHPTLITALMKIKDSYNVNALTQAMASAALDDQAYLLETVARIRATREQLSGGLVKMGFSVIPSDTNFVFAQPARRPAKELFEALRERNILVRYFSCERVSQYLRITVGTEAEIESLLSTLHEMGPV